MNIMNTNEENAKILADAIRTFAKHPENIDNFESYLSMHFDKWMELWANNPDKLAYEFKNFAEMI